MWQVFKKNENGLAPVAEAIECAGDMMMGSMYNFINRKVSFAALIAIALFFLLVIIQPNEQVQFSFLFWSISISQKFMLLVTVCYGVFVGLLVQILKRAPSPLGSNHEAADLRIERQETQETCPEDELQKFERGRRAVGQGDHSDFSRVGKFEKLQQASALELSSTKGALSDATAEITSLEDRINIMQGQIDVKKLIDVMVQHDLRNVLTAFVSLPETILDDVNLTENQRVIVRHIIESGERMLGILDSNLTLYRIEEGTYKKEFATVDLCRVISKIIDRMRPALLHFEQEISINFASSEGDQGHFNVYGDEFLLSGIFMNLISNACEASPAGKAISITFSRNENCLVAIRNYGEVAETIRSRFFEKMVTSGKKFGTGLGTYAAKLMVEAQNGQVQLDCSEPGVTTIHIRLPKPKD